MTRYSIKSGDNGHYDLAGVLDFETVPALLKETESWFQSGGAISIDLNEVSQANSAGMAILIEWKSLANQYGGSVSFQNIPSTIEHLAAVCKVEELLNS